MKENINWRLKDGSLMESKEIDEFCDYIYAEFKRKELNHERARLVLEEALKCLETKTKF